ncbi:MAG: hypothetical protein M3042_00405 [Actinomycetota bacterium]|nr:hypothetical protein [Actinomycetota bacterium]
MSLVTTPSWALARCAYCDGNRLTELTIRLTDGSSVQFESCHRCEGKTWSHEGTRLPLATILARSRKLA